MKYKHKTITLKNTNERTKEFFLLFCLKHFKNYSDNCINGDGFLFVNHERKLIGECDGNSPRRQESFETENLTEFADAVLEESSTVNYDLIKDSEFFLYKVLGSSYVAQKHDEKEFRLVWNSIEGFVSVDWLSRVGEFKEGWDSSIVPVNLGWLFSQAARDNS